MKSRHHVSAAGLGKSLDMNMIAEGLRDGTHWVSYGTVATFDAEVPDFTDPDAIFIGPEGVDVDVVLMPSMTGTTCRYSGIQGGSSCTIFAPIHPGDEVLVVLPSGDLGGIPVIIAILNAAHTRLPLDVDRKPFFRNDRLSIYTTDVPIDLRTKGGARLELDQNGTVVANGGQKGVARRDDTTKLSMDTTDIQQLAAALLATGLFTPSGAPPTPPTLPLVFAGGQITGASETVKAG